MVIMAESKYFAESIDWRTIKYGLKSLSRGRGYLFAYRFSRKALRYDLCEH